MNNTIVIKLGGSNFSKDQSNIFDFSYLSKFRTGIEYFVKSGFKFFIAAGGGFTMRRYRDLAIEAGINNKEELHWIGTTVNVLHGELIRAYFHKIADSGVYKYEDYYNSEKLKISKSVKIGGGGRPGHSGDVDAILACLKLGRDKIISLKNVTGIFDKDPNKFSSAVLQKSLTWDEYLDIINNETYHEPGANYPIDPIAARMAKDKHISFVVISGEDINNFKNVIIEKDFLGTIVK